MTRQLADERYHQAVMSRSPKPNPNPNPKPLDIFIVAEQFRYAGKFATLIPVLATANPGWFDVARDLRMPTAAMVCAAFSLELYFKCLIRTEKNLMLACMICPSYSPVLAKQIAEWENKRQISPLPKTSIAISPRSELVTCFFFAEARARGAELPTDNALCISDC